MRVLVTGATGFVGRALCKALRESGLLVRRAVRCKGNLLDDSAETAIVGDLDSNTLWQSALIGVDAVVHTAARVHVMKDRSADPLTDFRRVNTLGTIRLANEAAQAGVRRFIFLSSIKVNGEGTILAKPFTSIDTPQPADPYSLSKLEAEQGLQAIAQSTGMEIVIIRPVLVYGPGVKANFQWMMRWLRSGIPLPFGAVNNQRSLVALDNLIDLVTVCLNHPAAANRIFLVSDGEDLSTPELLRRLGTYLGSPARLLNVSERSVMIAARLINKREILQRLYGSLHVDIRETESVLGWRPPVGVNRALLQTAQDFLQQERK